MLFKRNFVVDIVATPNLKGLQVQNKESLNKVQNPMNQDKTP